MMFQLTTVGFVGPFGRRWGVAATFVMMLSPAYAQAPDASAKASEQYQQPKPAEQPKLSDYEKQQKIEYDKYQKQYQQDPKKINPNGGQNYPTYRGTEQDQQACIGDVFRLCNEFIPDATRIVACLKSKQPSLVPACRAVFARLEPAAKAKSGTSVRRRVKRSAVKSRAARKSAAASKR